MSLKFIDLFAGIGGMRIAFEDAGAECVLTCEINEDALKTYKANFKGNNNHIYHNDILTLSKDIVPKHNILVAGFPCQPYSIAGLRKGLKDERGGDVFLAILRILKERSPDAFLLENVKGLLNMGGYETKEDQKKQTGKVLKVILHDLEECGYKVSFKLFDSKDYDVPQKRQRVIIIGVRKDINFEPKWPEPSGTILTLRQAIGDLPLEYDESIQHVGTKHKCAVTGYLGNRELNWDEPSPTITGRGGGSGGPVIHNHPSLKRRLTVRECARIQTFPDSFVFRGSISSMYKQLGNAVPCRFSEYLRSIFELAPV